MRATLREQEIADQLASLTETERQLLQAVAKSRSTGDIAGELAVCVRTVESRRVKLMKKFGVGCLQEFTLFAAATVGDGGVSAEGGPPLPR